MRMGIGFGIVLALIVAVLILIVPTVIGIYVYRDAKKRNMNPALWTLLAVFAPGFIGLIIYLVARADRSPLNCPNCGYSVNEGFSVCPECGFSLKNKCPRCAMPLEYDWNVCPTCANPIPQNMKANPPVKPHKDKSIGKILILAVILPLILCIVLIISIVAFRSDTTYYGSSAYNSIETEYVYCPDIDIEQWQRDCDAHGKGVYYLKAAAREGRDVTTKVLIYRNDGEYDSDMMYSGGTLLKKASMEIHFIKLRGVGSTLSYYEYTDRREAEITFAEDDYIMESPPFTEVSDITINDYLYSSDYFYVEVYIPDYLDDFYDLGVTFYDEDGNADHSIARSDAYSGIESMSFSYDDLRGCERFSIVLQDERNRTIAESGVYDIYDSDGELNDYFGFYVTLKNGKNVIVCDDFDVVDILADPESQSE